MYLVVIKSPFALSTTANGTHGGGYNPQQE